jgi:hypothetical protein
LSDTVGILLIAASLPLLLTIIGHMVITWRALAVAKKGMWLDAEWKVLIETQNQRSIDDRALLNAHQQEIEQSLMNVIATNTEAARLALETSRVVEAIHGAVAGAARTPSHLTPLPTPTAPTGFVPDTRASG